MTSARWSGRQTPFLALLIPFVLVFMVDGRRGLRETLAGGADRRARVRRAPVRRVQLRLDGADRHHRVAGLGRCRRHAADACGPRAPAPRKVAGSPARDRRRIHLRRGARAQKAGRGRTAAHAQGDVPGVRAVHHHRRGARAGQPAPDSEPARQGHQRVQLARSERAHRQGQGADERDVQGQLVHCRRNLAAGVGDPDDARAARPPVARDTRLRSHAGPAQVGDPDRLHGPWRSPT